MTSRIAQLHPIEALARFGYGARGAVYLLVGAFATAAALELRDEASGPEEAFQAFAAWPLGSVWLMALAFGLSGFAVWRLLQAVLDADHQGRKPGALLLRAGQAASAVAYGLTAWSALALLDGVGDLREQGGSPQDVAKALHLPVGGSLLFLVAGLLAVVGAGNLMKAGSKSFGCELQCSAEICAWAKPVGRAGYAARGLVFVGVAALLVRTGLSLVGSDTDTLGVALGRLEALPFGSTLMAAMGAALAGFGLFGFVEARFRRIQAPEELGG